MKKRALLLSGGVNDLIDHPRYRNDIEAFFRVLTETWGYEENEVRLHVGKGSPLRMATARGPLVVQAHSARHQLVLEGLEWLAELGADDRVFFMATDHGEAEGISLWGKSNYLTPPRLASILDKSAATKILVFGQCFSGVFGLNMPRNSVVCTACKADESSWPRRAPISGMQARYDEFLYHLVGALAGTYPDEELLDSSVPVPAPKEVTIAQAFRYAKAMDEWHKTGHETPQLFDPDGLAVQLGL